MLAIPRHVAILYGLALLLSACGSGMVSDGVVTPATGCRARRLAAAQADERQAYFSMQKGLYTWQENTRLDELVVAHNVGRVHLYVGGATSGGPVKLKTDPQGIATLNATLHAKGVEIYALFDMNDGINDFTNYQRVTEVVDAVASFNQQHPDGAFDGLHLDHEPSDATVYPLLIDLIALVQQRKQLDTLSVPFTIAIKPLWLRENYTDGRPFFQTLLDVLDSAMFMDYSNNENSIANNGATFLRYAEQIHKPVEVGIETDVAPPANETLGPLLTSDPDAFYAMCSRLDAKFKLFTAYDRFTIHHYRAYVTDLYGQPPAVYTGPMPALGSKPMPPIDPAPTTPTAPEPAATPEASVPDCN